MAGINRVILVGHLGKDPEVRTIESGEKVVRFSLATNEAYRDKNGERKDVTEWHNIICWRKLADTAEKYLVKGSLIYVEGKLRTRTWENNGVKHNIVEVFADTFTMLGAKTDNVAPSIPATPSVPTTTSVPATATTPTSDTNDTTEKPELPPFITDEDELPF
jgi:single-strand DNA-binding protein